MQLLAEVSLLPDEQSLALSPGSQEQRIIQPFDREELQWLLQAVLHSTSPQSPLRLAALSRALLAADGCWALSAQQAANLLPVLPELVSLTHSLPFPKPQWKAWRNVALSTHLLSELLCAHILRLGLSGMGCAMCSGTMLLASAWANTGLQSFHAFLGKRLV